MAQQYGQLAASTPPRVHRQRAPIMSAPPPITAPLAPLRPAAGPLGVVSLGQPRPENERATNEYVETPFQRAQLLAPSPPPRRPLRPPVTKQPTVGGGGGKASGECAAGTGASARQSIVCGECGRCRCASCRQPRPLPQRWLCHDTCLLSPDSAIDYASCLCCVKGLFYHCSEAEGDTCADAPCGCGADRRRARWGCLAALSLLLPCLCLYWPLQGCKRMAAACYASHSRTGCRCAVTPEKRLLDAMPSDF